VGNTRKATIHDDAVDTVEVSLVGAPYQLKTRFARLKFLRLLATNPAEALAMVFANGGYERLEEVEMSDAEFDAVMEAVSSRLVGGPKG
jgi:hypothetical protein